uniref:E3 ubiquitin-protein ligase Topors n=1 Tax=Otus sunia TaxID=257818 RepID=A0A8C8B4I5_9STRI
MASGAEEALQDSGSATTASTKQLQQAGQWEAEADGLCPICLKGMFNAAYINTCFHTFCFGCIRRWAAMTAVCPLCRQPFSRILHTVRADDNYQEYMVSSSTHQQMTAARQRVRSRSPQQRYHLRPRPTNNQPAAGSSGPAGTNQVVLGDPAPRTSDTSTQQSSGERLNSPATDGPVLRLHVLSLQGQIIDFVDVD